MQRMFAEETPWHTPWMPRVIPTVASIIELDPARTIFTRFIPPRRPEETSGTWRRYYQRWEMMTLDRLDPGLIEIVPGLAGTFRPPNWQTRQYYRPGPRALPLALRPARSIPSSLPGRRPRSACSQPSWARLIAAIG